MSVNEISIWAGIASITLAIFSIILSIIFYVKSDRTLNKMNTAVENLKEFQKTFYSDTFALLKEAFSLFKDTQGAVTKHALRDREYETTEGVGKKEEQCDVVIKQD